MNTSMQFRHPAVTFLDEIGSDNMTSTSYLGTASNASRLRCMPSTSKQNASNSTVSNPAASGNPSASSSPASSEIGVHLRVTGQCSQGGRKYMEDYFSVAYQQADSPNDLEYAFVGIYDGHGGAEAAQFAKEHLMMQIVSQPKFWSDNDQDVLRAIREGYIGTHFAMWREQDKWPKTATGLPSTAGTTATVAFIRHDKLYIGHVGDSGVVLGYQNAKEDFWRAKQLTTDHKPDSVEERQRITRSGGKVVVKSGVPRVVWNRPRQIGHKGPVRHNTPVDEIPFLAVARSLGDLWSYNLACKEFIVSPDPELKVVKIDPASFRCLIFGTDGLWNVLTAQEAVNTVFEKEKFNQCIKAQISKPVNPNGCSTSSDPLADTTKEQHVQPFCNPSKSLVEKALKTWSAKRMRADNTSVVTVLLDQYVSPPPKEPIRPRIFESFGLEITQMSGDIVSSEFEDGMSYADLAQKFLPPLEYRDVNYDEEHIIPPIEQQKSLQSPEERGWTAFDYWLHDREPPAVIEEMDSPEEDSEDYEPEEDLLEEFRPNYRYDFASGDAYSNGRETSMEELESRESTSQHLDIMQHDYSLSFASSYTDSFLNISNSSSSSSGSSGSSSPLLELHIDSSSSEDSDVSYVAQPIDVTEQELLLHEQQLYREQCMSQEEGYSLTKLETRGEQQMRQNKASAGTAGESTKEVKTFKFFQQVPPNHESEVKMFANMYDNESKDNDQYSFMDSIMMNAHIHSVNLLRQERKAERALNRERKLQLRVAQRLAEERERQCPTTAQAEEPVIECMQADLVMQDNGACVSKLATTKEKPSSSRVRPSDAAHIQIHEITSSVNSPMNMMADLAEDDVAAEEEAATIVVVEPMEVDKVQLELELIEKIVILQNPPIEIRNDVVAAVKEKAPTSPGDLPKSAMLTRRHSKDLNNRPMLAATATSLSNANNNANNNNRAAYRNVPNENATRRRSNTNVQLQHQVEKCQQSQQQQLQHQQLAGGNEKRQLRSCVKQHPAALPPSAIDYIKRTLRSRNSLSKDLKAKSTHALPARRSATAVMGTSASALLAATRSTRLQQQQQQQQQNVGSVPQPATGNIVQVKSNTTARTTVGAAAALPVPAISPVQLRGGTRSAAALNLRSRQVQPGAKAVAAVSPKVSMSTLRGMCANLRATRASCARNLNNVCQQLERANITRRVAQTQHSQPDAAMCSGSASTAFGKTTRLQSSQVGHSLMPPAPSPKLLNNSAVVQRPTARVVEPCQRVRIRKGVEADVGGSGARELAAGEPLMLEMRGRAIQRRLNC